MDQQPSGPRRRNLPGGLRQGPCPTCRTVELVTVDGRCERCGTLIPRRDWMEIGLAVRNPVRRTVHRLGHALSRVGSGLGGVGWRLLAGLGGVATAAAGAGLLYLALRAVSGAPGHDLGAGLVRAALTLAVALPLGLRLLVWGRDLGALALTPLAPDELPALVDVELVTVELIRLRGSRGLSIEVTLGTSRLAPGARLEVAARLTRVDGVPIRAVLGRYRDGRGEAVARVVSPPVDARDDLALTLGLLLPLRALELEPGLPHLRGWVDLAIQVDGETVATRREELVVALGADDFGPAAPSSGFSPPGTAEGAIAILATREDATGSTCGVCGDHLAADPARACAACRARQHVECWTYLGRCATYGCEGRPGAAT